MIQVDGVMAQVQEELRHGGSIKVVLAFNGPCDWAVQVRDKRGKKVGPLLFPPEGESFPTLLHMLGELIEDGPR